MPLRIKLPPNEKIIINGAVIENGGDATTILLHNRVDILRRKEVLSQQDAITPARRIYYALQCAYLFEDSRAQSVEAVLAFLTDYQDAAPSAEALAERIRAYLDAEEFYEALKCTQDLIEHENERFRAIGLLPADPPAAEAPAAGKPGKKAPARGERKPVVTRKPAARGRAKPAAPSSKTPASEGGEG